MLAAAAVLIILAENEIPSDVSWAAFRDAVGLVRRLLTQLRSNRLSVAVCFFLFTFILVDVDAA